MTDAEETYQAVLNGSGNGRRPWLVVVLVAASIAMVMVLGVVLLANVFSRTETNADFAEAIQRERARATLENCQKQNARHRNTVRTLDRIIAGTPPARRRQARERRAGTVLLIQALVPLRECKRVVERTVVKGEPD
jgi:hypothetical protein